MTTYEYKCEKCHEIFESELKKCADCPQCGNKGKRIYSVPFLQGATVVKEQ